MYVKKNKDKCATDGLNIRKTCPCNKYPLCRGMPIFLILASKHRKISRFLWQNFQCLQLKKISVHVHLYIAWTSFGNEHVGAQVSDCCVTRCVPPNSCSSEIII